MLNEELYETLEQEFEKNKIEDAVEDILLEMAELLADQETTGKKLTCQSKAGKAKLRACGRCEEDGGVYIETLTINDHEYVIDDYFL